MNRNGNTYTIMYAAIMVILVAAILAFVAMTLKPKQVKNAEIEKKQSILASVNIESTVLNAEALYDENVKTGYLVNIEGNELDGDAFSVDLKKEYAKKDPKDMNLPVFECQTADGLKYILQLRGAGLWGPIWGFVALNEDMSTIYGANFDHQGETPGLGAEISTTLFEKQFVGKTIFDNDGKLYSIIVAKVGQEAAIEHKVDGISGGTITSKGLEKMLLDDFTRYEEFLKKKKS